MHVYGKEGRGVKEGGIIRGHGNLASQEEVKIKTRAQSIIE